MAVKGLDLIGCTLYRDILKEVLAWRAEFPEEADKQNGFTQSADALKEVDSFFFEQDSTAYYHAVRDWLKSSRLVEIMPDEKWHKTLKTMPQKNPRLKSRQRVNTIMSLDDKLINGILATYQSAIAGLETNGKVITLREMRHARTKNHPLSQTPDYDFANPDYMVWDLETSVGPLFGFMHSNEIVICDGVREDGFVNTVHRRSVARINHQLSIAKDQKPARYAYELLRKVAPSEEIAILSFVTVEQGPEELAHGLMVYGITTHMGSEYAMSLGKTGAMLHTRYGGQSLMSMSSREFEALKAEDLSKLT